MILRSLSTILFLLAAWSMQAQTRPYITLGLGFPESLAIGIKVPTGTCMIGTSFTAGSEYAAATTDFAYHFGGRARPESLRPWFLRVPVTLDRTAPDRYGENGSYSMRAAMRFGYAWFPAPGIGVSLEAGPVWRLFEDDSGIDELGARGPGLEPGFNLMFYVRL